MKLLIVRIKTAVTMSETMYGSVYEDVTTLFVDMLVFLFKSIFYILESFYLTLLPDRFRKLKVR